MRPIRIASIACRGAGLLALAGLCWLLLLSGHIAPSAVAEGAADSSAAKAPGENGKAARHERLPEQTELTPVSLGLRVGERLLYDIRVNGILAGKALLEVRKTESVDVDKGPQVWLIELHTRSNRAMSLLYDVNDRAWSRIDVKGGFSRFYRIEKKEGDLKSEERIKLTYDIGSMEAVYERPRADSQWRRQKVPLAGKALDPLSALYYLRAVDLSKLQPGDAIRLPICADRRLWNMPLRVVDRSVENAGYLKGRPCVVVEPDAEFQGLFERKGRMRVWLDAATNIPVKMTAEIPIGTAEAVLSEATASPLPEKQ